MAKEGWESVRLLTITITDSLAVLAIEFAHQYYAASPRYQAKQRAEDTWLELHGPPTEESLRRLHQIRLQVEAAKNEYQKIMDRIASAKHSEGKEDTQVSEFENASPTPGHAQALLRTIDDAAWRLLDLWPRAKWLVLEANLNLQQSGRRWHRLAAKEPNEISAEYERAREYDLVSAAHERLREYYLVQHEFEMADAALELLNHAFKLYAVLVVLKKDIYKAAIETGSDLDKVAQAIDRLDKLV